MSFVWIPRQKRVRNFKTFWSSRHHYSADVCAEPFAEFNSSPSFSRAIISECMASFLYVFIVCGAAAGAGIGASVSSVLLTTSIASGLAIAVLTHCFLHISGKETKSRRTKNLGKSADVLASCLRHEFMIFCFTFSSSCIIKQSGAHLHFRLSYRRSHKSGRNHCLLLHSSHITAQDDDVHLGSTWRRHCRCRFALRVRNLNENHLLACSGCSGFILGSFCSLEKPYVALCHNSAFADGVRLFIEKKKEKTNSRQHKKNPKTSIKNFKTKSFLCKRSTNERRAGGSIELQKKKTTRVSILCFGFVMLRRRKYERLWARKDSNYRAGQRLDSL